MSDDQEIIEEQEQPEELPQKLKTLGDIPDPDMAEALALQALHNPENPQSMGVLDGPDMLLAPRMMYALSDGLALDFLRVEADRYLRISASVVSKKTGCGRQDTKDALQSLHGGEPEEEGGFLKRAKSFITRQG